MIPVRLSMVDFLISSGTTYQLPAFDQEGGVLPPAGTGMDLHGTLKICNEHAASIEAMYPDPASHHAYHLVEECLCWPASKAPPFSTTPSNSQLAASP